MACQAPDGVLQDQIDAVLDDFYTLHDTSNDPVLDAVLVAIFVEDAFGVTLAEAEIAPAHLSDRAAVRKTLQRHLAG